MRQLQLILIAMFITGCCFASDPTDMRWWPAQKAPQSIIKTSLSFIEPVSDIPDVNREMDVKLGPTHMMLQSVAGLAALAVNEDCGDQLVWIEHMPVESHSGDYQRWLTNVQKRLDAPVVATLKPWELVAHFHAKGVVKGYILYSLDTSKGIYPDVRPGLDHSANAATMACPFLGGIIISEELESQAQRLGLKKLLDVRGKDEAFTFEMFKDKLNRHLALAQDPRMPHQRALAIANKVPVVFGLEEPTPTIYDWLEPTTYIMGWNAPGEGEFIEQLSEYGHILLPSNWAMNLPVLAAGSENYHIPKFKQIDAKTIDYTGPAVSFIMSDGDNVQWLMGDFCTHKYYWASSDHGDFPIGWGMPYACLAQVAPEVCDYLHQTQPDQCTFNLHAGGYYFPDRFGVKLSKATREKLLRQHARKLNHYMTQIGYKTLMFICRDLDSPEALAAYKIFAEEIDDLVAMFGLEYGPYEAEEGRVLWTEDQNGIKIPVLTCKYCIWANLDLPGSGTPAKIARLINSDIAAHENPQPYLNWAVIHAWSGFNKIDGNDETAENAQFMAPGTHAGVTPTEWCIERLDKNIKVVTPIELAWRVRMAHYPEQTRKLLEQH